MLVVVRPAGQRTWAMAGGDSGGGFVRVVRGCVAQVTRAGSGSVVLLVASAAVAVFFGVGWGCNAGTWTSPRPILYILLIATCKPSV